MPQRSNRRVDNKNTKNTRNTRKPNESVTSYKGYEQPVKHMQLSPAQKTVGNLIKCNSIIFVEGAAGTGKTTGILAEFVKQYLADPTKNIVVIRTPVEAGDDKVGYLPAELEKKIEPHFHSTEKVLWSLLDKGKAQADKGRRIHFAIPNYILGDTLDNSLILIDESQQLSPKVLKLLLERIGKNSTCVVAGDPSQLYVNDRKRNALTDAKDRFFRKDEKGNLVARFENVAHFQFSVDDVQRSDIVKTVIKAYSDML